MDESTTPDAQLTFAVQSPHAAHPETPYSESPYIDEKAWVETPDASIAPPGDSHPRRRMASWLLLCRLPTLLLGLAPVLLSLALLWAHNARLSPIPAICAPLAVMLALAGGNMLDEYVELARSAGQSWLREPGGGYYAGNVLEHSGIRPRVALRISLVLLALSALVGVPVVIAGGVPVLVLGIVSLTCVVLYSATRVALKRLPVGELVLLLALGPGLVAATVLSQRASLSLEYILIGLALGLFAAALIEAAHLRDVEIDRRAGRRTLPAVLGKRVARRAFAFGIIAAYVLVLAAALLKGDIPGTAASILALPAMLLALTGVVRAQSANASHFAVVQTMRAYVAFAAWLGVGIVAWRLVELLIPWVIFYFGG